MADSWLTEDLDGPAPIASSSAAGPSSGPSLSGQARRRGRSIYPDRDIDGDIPPRRDRTEVDERGEAGSRDELEFEEEEDETALAKLMRSWLNERHSPDLLVGEETVVGRLLDHVRKQVCSKTFSRDR